MGFIVALLKDNPKATYAEVRAGAEKRGLEVYPIMYGRAQAMLGLVRVAPRGTGQARRHERAAATAKSAASSRPAIDNSSLAGLVKGIREKEAQRARYRAALERVGEILREALA